MQEDTFSGRIADIVIFRVPEFGARAGLPLRMRDGIRSSALLKVMWLENSSPAIARATMSA
jgi:hypothetical protein